MEIRDLQAMMQYQSMQQISTNNAFTDNSPMVNVAFKQLLDDKINQDVLDNRSSPAFQQTSMKQSPDVDRPEESTTPSTDVSPAVSHAAKKFDMDPELIHSIIKSESNYNTNAESNAGAQGLMQLMPETARELGITDPYDPEQNIEGGTKYLSQMLNRYNDNLELAVAAYNAGPGKVDQYQGIPPNRETKNYVQNVMDDYLT